MKADGSKLLLICYRLSSNGYLILKNGLGIALKTICLEYGALYPN